LQVIFDFGLDIFLLATVRMPGTEVCQAIQSIRVNWKPIRNIDRQLPYGKTGRCGLFDPKHLARYSSLKYIYIDVPSSVQSMQFASFVDHMDTAMNLQVHLSIDVRE
jgi:hypothetical protein